MSRVEHEYRIENGRGKPLHHRVSKAEAPGVAQEIADRTGKTVIYREDVEFSEMIAVHPRRLPSRILCGRVVRG